MVEPTIIGRATLYLGDCRDVLPTLADNSAALAFTSPPYNLGEGMEDKGGLRVGHGGSKWKSDKLRQGYGEYDDAMPYADYAAWQGETLTELWRICSGAVFYNHKPRVVKRALRLPLFADLPLRQIIIWDRGSGFNCMSGAFMPVSEWIMLYAKAGWSLRDKSASALGDVWRIPAKPDPHHPASFPLELPLRALEASPAGDVIDPFMGSGQTGCPERFAMTKPLALVPPSPQPVIDIYANWRAEIKARDWSKVHIDGGKRGQVFIPDPVRRPWR